MTNNYSKIHVSQTAKEYALNIIAWLEIPDTNQLGFWLGIPLESDYVVLAIYADKCLQDKTVSSPSDVVELLRKEIPTGWLLCN